MAGFDFIRSLVPPGIKKAIKSATGIAALQAQVADIQTRVANIERSHGGLEVQPPDASQMRELWNSLSKRSKLGFISHLQDGEQWDEEEFHTVGVRFVNRMIERFEEYGNIEPGRASILEIGCGVGRFIKPLAARFAHVCGVDISEEMIRVAREYCSDLDNVELLTNDGSTLRDFEDDSFDYCVSAGVFQHITHIGIIIEYIQEAIRVLKPEGLFLFQFFGSRTEPIGTGTVGARITAGDLDSGLRGVEYGIREISMDPGDPLRNIVVVLQKPSNGVSFTECEKSFRLFGMTDRPWLSGVYDGIKTKTQMQARLNKEPDRMTFYDEAGDSRLRVVSGRDEREASLDERETSHDEDAKASKWTEREIREEIKKFDEGIGWYQDIDLGSGIHTKTRRIWGEELDHPRIRWEAIARAVPADLRGYSVLDVGCNAGYFAFEAKRRGADYVCGVDLKQEYIDQAKFCAEVKNVDVDFRTLNVSELETLGRKFDLVFFVGLLYHCRYLTTALDQVANVTKSRIIVESAIHPDDSDIPLVRFVRSSQYMGPQAKGAARLTGHWHPNMTALKDFFYERGFSKINVLFKKGGRGGIVADR